MDTEEKSIHSILAEVNAALTEKNYNPIDQIVGYILSGAPPISRVTRVRGI
jgi:uncharacterized protein (UPF0297 family)